MPAAIASLPMRASTARRNRDAVDAVADQEAQVVRPDATGPVLRESAGALLHRQQPGVRPRLKWRIGLSAERGTIASLADRLPVGGAVALEARDRRRRRVASTGRRGATRPARRPAGARRSSASAPPLRGRHGSTSDRSQRPRAACGLGRAPPDLLLRVRHEAGLAEELEVLADVGAGRVEARHVVAGALVDERIEQVDSGSRPPSGRRPRRAR